MYGELPNFQFLGAPRIGSAPRVRGTLGLGPAFVGYPRFSPACTGNSCIAQSIYAIAAVQPRVYGELCVVRFEFTVRGGSAPRVRGTPTIAESRDFLHRFSPACTGNSKLNTGRLYVATVQPRVYGELLVGNQLIPSYFSTVKDRTTESESLLCRSRTFIRSLNFYNFNYDFVFNLISSSGKKLTNLKPSKSIGTRLLVPVVSKS